MDLKVIGLGALINVALTVLLTYIFLPIVFIGPLFGGFLSSYLSKGYEDYDKMDRKDGAVVGAISGLIGGLIISLLFILGIGNIDTTIGLISNNPEITSIIIRGLIIINVTVDLSLILGIIGGVIGVIIKRGLTYPEI
jgi:hypothetical protein